MTSPSEDNAPHSLDLLKRAAAIQAQRGKDYQRGHPNSREERSMAKVVKVFNEVTGWSLTEADGWLLMVLLKIVRSETGIKPHQDSIEDLVSYAALFGEARLAKR